MAWRLTFIGYVALAFGASFTLLAYIAGWVQPEVKGPTVPAAAVRQAMSYVQDYYALGERLDGAKESGDRELAKEYADGRREVARRLLSNLTAIRETYPEHNAAAIRAALVYASVLHRSLEPDGNPVGEIRAWMRNPDFAKQLRGQTRRDAEILSRLYTPPGGEERVVGAIMRLLRDAYTLGRRLHNVEDSRLLTSIHGDGLRNAAMAAMAERITRDAAKIAPAMGATPSPRDRAALALARWDEMRLDGTKLRDHSMHMALGSLLGEIRRASERAPGDRLVLVIFAGVSLDMSDVVRGASRFRTSGIRRFILQAYDDGRDPLTDPLAIARVETSWVGNFGDLREALENAPLPSQYGDSRGLIKRLGLQAIRAGRAARRALLKSTGGDPTGAPAEVRAALVYAHFPGMEDSALRAARGLLDPGNTAFVKDLDEEIIADFKALGLVLGVIDLSDEDGAGQANLRLVLDAADAVGKRAALRPAGTRERRMLRSAAFSACTETLVTDAGKRWGAVSGNLESPEAQLLRARLRLFLMESGGHQQESATMARQAVNDARAAVKARGPGGEASRVLARALATLGRSVQEKAFRATRFDPMAGRSAILEAVNLFKEATRVDPAVRGAPRALLALWRMLGMRKEAKAFLEELKREKVQLPEDTLRELESFIDGKASGNPHAGILPGS